MVQKSDSIGTESLFYWYRRSQLLVERCNGATAGQGYLEVVGIVHAIPPLSSRLVSALPIPIGGERFNSSTDFNLNTNSSILLHCKQASSLQAHSHLVNTKRNNVVQNCIMCNRQI